MRKTLLTVALAISASIGLVAGPSLGQTAAFDFEYDGEWLYDDVLEIRSGETVKITYDPQKTGVSGRQNDAYGIFVCDENGEETLAESELFAWPESGSIVWTAPQEMGWYFAQAFDLDIRRELGMLWIHVVPAGAGGPSVVVKDIEETFVYDGRAHEPLPEVKDAQGRVLDCGTDYKCHWVNNVNASERGAAIITVMEGNYEGVFTNWFSIAKREVSLATGSRTWTYDGRAHSASEINVVKGSFVEGEGVHFVNFATITDVGTKPNTLDLVCTDETDADNYAITILPGVLQVMPQRVSADNFAIGASGPFVYDGTAQEPRPTVTDRALGSAVPGVTYEWWDNRHAGETAMVVVCFSGNYEGAVTNAFTIEKRKVTLESASRTWTYDGAFHSCTNVAVGGDGFVCGDGVITADWPSIREIGTVANSFSWSFAPGGSSPSRLDDYEITARGCGLLEVLPAMMESIESDDPFPFDADNPQAPPSPLAADGTLRTLSDYDSVGEYDGGAHTFDADGLWAALRKLGLADTAVVTYSSDGRNWRSEPLALTNASSCAFWYRVCAAGYRDFVHAVGVTVTPPAVLPDGRYTETVDGIEWTYVITNGEAVLGGAAAPVVPTATRGAIVVPPELGRCPVTTIGDGAFGGCREITSVKLPPSVCLVTGSAFSGCTGLTAIDVDEANANYSTCDGLLLNKDGTTLVACPNGLDAVTIPAGVTGIGRAAFSGGALREVTIPVGVTQICGEAFANCASLRTVCFEGDAPTLDGSGIYAGTPSNLVTYVNRGTTGWTGGDGEGLPETWPTGDGAAARAIAYIPLPPTAVIDAILPEKPTDETDIVLNGHGAGERPISECLWTARRIIDGIVSEDATPLCSSQTGRARLPVGTWRIEYRVKDSAGLWSEAASADVTVTVGRVAVVAFAGDGGSVTPCGTNVVLAGTSPVYRFAPELGYAVAGVYVDGQKVTSTNEYVFENIAADHVLRVEFAAIPLDFGEAVGLADRPWTTGGAGAWRPQWSAAAADGAHDAVVSGLANGESAWIETTVEGAGTVSFAWRGAMAASGAKVQFFVDDLVETKLVASDAWQSAQVKIYGGDVHTLRWRLLMGRSGADAGDYAELDCVTWTPTEPPTLAEALNADLKWTTDGDEPWHGVGWESPTEERDAWAEVSGLGNLASAAVETQVYGSGVLKFDWAVSCEPDYDELTIVIDGQFGKSISGESGWRTDAVAIDGKRWHSVRWVFAKDAMDDPALVGDNLAMLDNVVWQSADKPPDSTRDTPVAVPYEELKTRYGTYLAAAKGDYEAAAMATGRNGCAIWESYVAGLDPDDKNSRFIARIDLSSGTPKVTWDPPLNGTDANGNCLKTGASGRVYTVRGSNDLKEWVDVPDEAELMDFLGKAKGKPWFFRVDVALPQGKSL